MVADVPVIAWVNHASYIISCNEVSLITDPWLFGTVFNDSWELTSETKLSPWDFERITHIWFSHEHPDHFSPASLDSIPEAFRRNITVLFQKTHDRRLVGYCEDLGFPVIEMEPDRTYELSDYFSVMCRPLGHLDSWLFAVVGGKKILNLNDCIVDSYKKARQVHQQTNDVDVLLTQFSYSQWEGNPEDVELRKSAARQVLEGIKTQASVLKPHYIIPFASFVRFCHVNNSYMNNEVNTIHDAEQFVREETGAVPIVLYPGNEWVVGNDHDNTEALAAYGDDLGNSKKPLVNPPAVTVDELEELALSSSRRIRQNNSWLSIRLLYLIKYLKTAKVFVHDLNACLSFDMIHGIREGNFNPTQADIVTDSDSLAYALKYGWGLNSLWINGRFRRASGNLGIFFRNFSISKFNSSGWSFPLGVARVRIRERLFNQLKS